MKKIVLLVLSCTSFIEADFGTTVHKYLWANYKQFTGKSAEANQWYSEVLSDPGSAYTYKGYIHFLFDTQQPYKIVQVLKRVGNKFDNDPEVQLMHAVALEATGQQKKADDLLIRINDKFKTDQEIAFRTVQMYLRKKEPKNALKVTEELLNASFRKPNDFIFYFLQAQIYTQLNNKELAYKSVKKCLEMHPGFDKGWLLLAALEEEAGKLKEAIAGYTTYLELIKDSNQLIEKHLLSLILKQKLTEKHNHQQAVLINLSCFEKALILFKRKQYKEALQEIDKCLRDNPKNVDSRLLKIQILTELRHYDSAISLLTQWITKEESNQLWYQALYLLSKNTHLTKDVIAAFEKIAKRHPKNVLPSLYLADMFIRIDNQEQAIAHLKKAETQTRDATLKTKTLFQAAVIYYEQEQYAQMKEVLHKVIVLSPSFAPAHNLLAYFYATKGKDIKKAQGHISQALEQNTSNPHFLDTQAVIFYKKHEYKKAHQILTELTKTISNDATMLINLAKVEYKLKHKDKALEYLKAATNHTRHVHEQRSIKKYRKKWAG